MESKLCHFRGQTGTKVCALNCAIHTPLGCSVKVIADQFLINSRGGAGDKIKEKKKKEIK